MRNLTWYVILGVALTSPILAPYPQYGAPVIVSPRQGDVLQGVVTITGSSDMTGFLSVEISFTYAGETTGTWFQIAVVNQPVLNGILATWDTTVINDGEYELRLRVYLTDGRFYETVVSGLSVENDTPRGTTTMTIITPTAIPLSTIIPTTTLFPTPTDLPRNPAALAPTDVSTSILYGGLAAIITFVIAGIYLWMRRK